MPAKTKKQVSIPEAVVENKIYEVRGHKVMIDRDLAQLYGLETRVLKQTVKRNLKRFPKDFMFTMTQKEFAVWRSQFVISKEDRQGLRHAPFCFTEPGVTMLACILNSPRAIAMNIRIVRVFTRLRKALLDTSALQLEIQKIRKKMDDHDANIELVFRYLDELLEQKENPAPRKRIGFKKDH